jgi:hypothetical protein
MPGAGCPNPDCPPTEKAPIDVPESDDEAGAEPDRFTADEVAALLVPLDTIDRWHQEGTVLRVSRVAHPHKATEHTGSAASEQSEA